MITQELINQIIKKIVKFYQPEKIILFGSYAWGNPTEESDIDLLIVKQTTESFSKRWAEVCDLIDEVVPTVPLSPFVFTPEEIDERIKIGDQFFHEILEKGESLYAKQ